jgi:hypothetical protein
VDSEWRPIWSRRTVQVYEEMGVRNAVEDAERLRRMSLEVSELVPARESESDHRETRGDLTASIVEFRN